MGWVLSGAARTNIAKSFANEKCYHGMEWISGMLPELRAALGNPSSEFAKDAKSQAFYKSFGSTGMAIVGGTWANLVQAVQDQMK